MRDEEWGCKRQQVGTKGNGKMMKRILVLEVGRIPAKDAGNWKIEEQKKENYKERKKEIVE